MQMSETMQQGSLLLEIWLEALLKEKTELYKEDALLDRDVAAAIRLLKISLRNTKSIREDYS